MLVPEDSLLHFQLTDHFSAKQNETFFTWDKYSHLALCLDLIQPNCQNVTDGVRKVALLLNEVVDGHDDRDGRKEYGRGVGDDQEGGDDAQQAGHGEPDHQRHRRVQHVHVLAEPEESMFTASSADGKQVKCFQTQLEGLGSIHGENKQL